jgi:hypothetical protein
MDKDTKEILKINTINIAKHHRKYCEGEQCNVSLMLLLELLNRAGIEMTDKEKIIFI